MPTRYRPPLKFSPRSNANYGRKSTSGSGQVEKDLLITLLGRMIQVNYTVLPLDCIFGEQRLDAVRYGFKLVTQHPFMCLLSTYGGGQFKLAINEKIELCKFYPKCAKSCGRLHLCKHYISTGMEKHCKFGSSCWYEHSLSSPHNMRVLSEKGLDSIPVHLLKGLIRLCGEDSSRMVKLCADTHCNKRCKMLHGCFFHFARNDCKYGQGCAFGHVLATKGNRSTLRHLGLDDVPEAELQRYVRLIYSEANCKTKSILRYHASVPMMLILRDRPNINSKQLSNSNANNDKASVDAPANDSAAERKLLSVHFPCDRELGLPQSDNSPFLAKIVDMNQDIDGLYAKVMSMFKETMGNVATISTVKRIINSLLYTQFIRNLTDARDDITTKQYWTFCGLRKEQVPLFAFENVIGNRRRAGSLDVSGGTDQGYLYMLQAREAHRFTDPDENGFRYMFVVRVACESEAKDEGGPGSRHLFHSIINPCACYPEFLIKYIDL